jgi:hypothetical protein
MSKKADKIKMGNGIACNQNYFATVISACSFKRDLESTSSIGHAVLSGFETKVSVSNYVISLFVG